MVRSASAVRVLRRGPTAESALVTERMLRKLTDENRRLRRELRELRKLERGAHQDLLNGVAHRGLFEACLREELSRASRAPGQGGVVLAVALCGVDGVDAHTGTPAGGDALGDVTRAVRDGLRSGDVCCRTGADELMILLPETDALAARAVLQRLRAAVFRLGARRDLAIAFSGGAASWPADGTSAPRLMALAQAAMRTEKRRLRARERRAPVGRFGLALVKR